ncbi:hypothetical protein BABINDRAFT_159224 [Babjeviella inositovora NRRL Y-12698]|uniref:Ribosome biogenesis protein ALB1 n=1 Tax=Babjeviella inositovora NRRL Y-12698 TaxID=984486 RepID=A0A1E3QYE2_9ASCO|nr:uncharacterized protein BABINDRAFT_159224 [Babjeviella inositovora NRRL Y-12698]ODQ82699.1 hypothetical protein BABINDRAFT_159224 [Babjeviella inositovora NRRL Y-12698]
MRKAHSIGKKRAAKVRAGAFAPARSDKESTSGQPKSTAVALYTGKMVPTGVHTNTLSNKRLKKIERNKKYVAARNVSLLIDVAAKQEEKMEIDEENIALKKDVTKKTQASLVRDALWSIIEDRASEGLSVQITGDGTTLGSAVF